MIATLGSCVTSKVHNDLKSKYESLNTEHETLKKDFDKLSTDFTELKAKYEDVSKRYDQLVSDTLSKGLTLRKLQRNYEDLNKNYDFLLKNNNTLLANNARENKALLARLETLQDQLEEKEDSLKSEQMRLKGLSDALLAREKRVNELESLIARKDSVVEYVRQRVSEALMGFQGKGLTVEMKNGLVYVSMENSLLFASGSWTVQEKGKQALEKLAVVLAENEDISIMVEGHTDNDAYRAGGQVSDNWDLSVMRATSVVKILTGKSKVDPKRITAAGRGEYVPLADNSTPEGKAKNRRTEVILSPNLGELATLLEEMK